MQFPPSAHPNHKGAKRLLSLALPMERQGAVGQEQLQPGQTGAAAFEWWILSAGLESHLRRDQLQRRPCVVKMVWRRIFEKV